MSTSDAPKPPRNVRERAVRLVEKELSDRLPADRRIDFIGTASAIVTALQKDGWHHG